MQIDELGSLTQWLANEFAERKKTVAVVGVSGGIDSAVVYRLCQKAELTIQAIYLPFRTSSPEGLVQVDKLMNRYCSFDISPLADAFNGSRQWQQYARLKPLPNSESNDEVGFHLYGGSTMTLVRCGNFCARIRMAILYDVAAQHNGLVVGTSNATELALGYGTRHGDCACDINPIANLYKREVRQLAEWLDVPQEIRDAVPSAGLWEGQTDEEELGFTYEDADNYLMGIPYRHLRPDGVAPEVRAKIEARIEANKFKSEPVPTWQPGNYAR